MVVLGKWIASKPKVLILDEPTRGVDVAAKQQVHQMIHDRAAGGLAAGAIAFMDGSIVSGIETVMKHSNLEAELKSADWVITGEGSFDRQSLHGKVVSGILNLATQSDTRVAVLAGQVKIGPDEYRKLGIEVALASKPDDLPLADALKNSRELLAAAAKRLAQEHLAR